MASIATCRLSAATSDLVRFSWAPITTSAFRAFWRFWTAVLYRSSRMDVCCSSWASVASIWDTCACVELICDWFGAGPGRVVDEDVPVAPAPGAPSDGTTTHVSATSSAARATIARAFRCPGLRQTAAPTEESVTGAGADAWQSGCDPRERRTGLPPKVWVMRGVVSLACGRVRGVWRGDMWSFSGIPYAQAPVGESRWRPPRPPDPWDEVRDASTFGPIAPQSPTIPGIMSPSDPEASEPQSEDCLSLNVWTPEILEDPTAAPGSGRPVLVWIHGGGFTSGSGSVFLYRGGNLVRNGDAVVVTINYRLGALGFLGHRQLMGTDGLIGNWGLHDQVAALRWVRDNIAAFGGDAANVTVFGESAGGFSVAALLGTPSAVGLFRRAIVQSGGAHVHSVAQAERSAERVASILGIAGCDRESLGRVPASELVAATEEVGRRRPDPGMLPLPFLPVVDGVFLPRHPLAAVAAGTAAGVDLLIGTNRDELTLFGLGNPALTALDEDGVLRWLSNAAPGRPRRRGDGGVPLGAPGPVRRRSSATDIWVAAGTDIVFRWPSLQLAATHTAQGSRAFVYLFDWESPAFGGILGSCHALELPFVFGAVHLPAVQLLTGDGPGVALLCEQMQGAWLAFARSGSPAHEGIGEWRPWEPAHRATMVFGAHTGSADAPRDDELAVLERHHPLVAS